MKLFFLIMLVFMLVKFVMLFIVWIWKLVVWFFLLKIFLFCLFLIVYWRKKRFLGNIGYRLMDILIVKNLFLKIKLDVIVMIVESE